MAKTTYVILWSDHSEEEGGLPFRIVGEVRASGARTALRQFFHDKEVKGVGVAVPKINFQPKPVVTTTQTRLEVG